MNRNYRFEWLDKMDEDHRIRLYGLASLPPGTMDRVVELLSPFMTPTWPTWAPLWKFPTEDDRLAVEQAVDELIACAAAPEFAISTAGLLDEIGDVVAQPEPC